jgi:hypothetical protein
MVAGRRAFHIEVRLVSTNLPSLYIPSHVIIREQDIQGFRKKLHQILREGLVTIRLVRLCHIKLA